MSRGGVYEGSRVKCPYYRFENRCVIFCEGVQPQQSIHMAFGDGGEKRAYEKQFCHRIWSDCMIAAGHNARLCDWGE